LFGKFAKRASKLSPQNVNNHFVLVKMLFKSARRDSVCLDNPAEFIGTVRAPAKPNSKRAFTLSELQAILALADGEWPSMILFGLYTGQRLSDLVRLEWSNIDLERGEVRLVTSKTSRVMTIPMEPALRIAYRVVTGRRLIHTLRCTRPHRESKRVVKCLQ
jgi:integrase